jgi:K+-sensing histidine kinase KdpD
MMLAWTTSDTATLIATALVLQTAFLAWMLRRVLATQTQASDTQAQTINLITRVEGLLDIEHDLRTPAATIKGLVEALTAAAEANGGLSRDQRLLVYRSIDDELDRFFRRIAEGEQRRRTLVPRT